MHEITGPTRRDFLRQGIALLGAGCTIPAYAGAVRQTAGKSADRILVVIHLAGGNDGLNTVVPFRNDVYYRYRPSLGIPRSRTLMINDDLGFHPAAVGLKHLYDDGLLAIVQGAGFPDMSRSHFQCMNLWESALPGIDFTTENAIGATFTESLRSISRMILSGAPVRMYRATLNGFDTHSNQTSRHAQLLTEFGDAIEAFVTELKRHRLLDRVAIMTCSEFGRGVGENAAGGTDHGQAAPLFLIGTGVRPGLHGDAPQLASPDNFAVGHTVDIRRIGAAAFNQWLRIPVPAFAGRFDAINVFHA